MRQENEAEILLPWLHNGSLQGDEEQLANNFVQDDVDFSAAERQFDKELEAALKRQSVGSPGEFGWARFQRDISKTAAEKPTVIHDSKWLKPALAAAIVFMAIEAGFILQSTQEPVHYVPLGQEQRYPVVLQIEFQPDATEKSIRLFLNQVEGQVIDGPSALGIYRVALDLSANDKAGIENRILAIADHPLVIRHVSRD